MRPSAATLHRQPRGQCWCAILLVERPAYSPASLAGPGLSFCTMGVDESDHSTVARERLGPQLIKETPSLFYLHCEPAAGRRRSTRPCDPAACLPRPEERPIPAQPLGRWSPLTRRSRTMPPTASDIRKWPRTACRRSSGRQFQSRPRSWHAVAWLWSGRC